MAVSILGASAKARGQGHLCGPSAVEVHERTYSELVPRHCLPEGMGRDYCHDDQDEVLELLNNFKGFNKIVERLQHPLSKLLAKCLQNPRIQDRTQNDQVQASCTVGRSGTAPKE